MGTYAAANLHAQKAEAIRNAKRHFPQFLSMVRPMREWPAQYEGTLTDRLLYICTGQPKPWAFLVLIRTGHDMHCVAVPVMEDDEGAARFVRFLKEAAARFEVRLAKFAGDQWEVAKDTRVIEWPEPRFD